MMVTLVIAAYPVSRDVIPFCSYKKLVRWALWLSRFYRRGNRFRKKMPKSKKADQDLDQRFLTLQPVFQITNLSCENSVR